MPAYGRVMRANIQGNLMNAMYFIPPRPCEGQEANRWLSGYYSAFYMMLYKVTYFDRGRKPQERPRVTATKRTMPTRSS
ncbi:hypothetical protein DYST_00287 [Dyella terrae]|nr:hypothetical protein DYST_00287 [Dyella terrae]